MLKERVFRSVPPVMERPRGTARNALTPRWNRHFKLDSVEPPHISLRLFPPSTTRMLFQNDSLRSALRFRFVFAALSLVTLNHVAAAEKPGVPDFVQGDGLPENAPHDWNLGPTGMRGWVHCWKGESSDSRQILVTKVDDGSPAHELIRKGDVIVGVGTEPFDSDARIALAHAIVDAEADNGELELGIWREGQSLTVKLQLEPIGTYAPTAPFECRKSDTIVDRGCEAIAKSMSDRRRRIHPIVRALNAMALLASGEKRYLPLVQQEAEWAAEFQIRENDLHSWSSGWVTIFLAEYVIATGDRSVLPALARLSRAIAEGQSVVGTWGHRFAYPHNGILRGYGAMNQVGLNLTTGLLLAREAGVDDEKVNQAIETSTQFLRFYVDRGAIPYGDHHPWLETHDDNGKCSAAAVMFDLYGDAEATRFYSKMATASFGIERETGHTGNFFNMIWALPGVSRLGRHATGVWIAESDWLLDLARRWDGSFAYNGKPAATGGEHSYRSWDCTGAYVLGYAVARNKTRLTGLSRSSTSPLKAESARGVIEDGFGWMPIAKSSSYETHSTQQLMQELTSWSPVVRERAAKAIATRADVDVAALTEMAGNSERSARYGACAALEELGPKAANSVPALTDLLGDDDLWLRVQAAEALAAIGAPAKSAVPDLCRLVSAPADDSDPRAMVQRYVAFALFYPGRALKVRGLLARSLGDVDRDLLISAASATLNNEDGRVRDAAGNVYGMLKEEEIEKMMPAVYRAVTEQAPSGVMFSDGIRMRGLELLARHRIKEGLPLCVSLIEPERWGSDRRFQGCMKVLRIYGAAAKPLLPQLRELESEIRSPRAKGHKHHKEIVELIDWIDAAEPSNDLKSLATLGSSTTR